MPVFDTESVRENFTFEDNDRTAIFKKGYPDHLACVVTRSKSDVHATVRFKFSNGGWFGIWFTKDVKGLPGYDDSNGWTMHASGVAAQY